MYTRNKQLIFFLCGSLLGFLFFAAALCLLPVLPVETQAWKGYHTVLLDRDADVSLLETRFAAAGFEEVLHHDNVEIEYFDFDGLSAVKLKDIPDRFEVKDPRIDPYMRELHRYFQTNDGVRDYSIVYVREKDNPVSSLLQSVRVLRETGTSWRLADVKPLFTVMFTGMFGIVLIFILLADREGRWLLLAGSVPWAVFVLFGGGYYEFFAASLVMVTFSVFLQSSRPVFRFYLNHGYVDGGSRKAVFALTLLILAVLASLLLLIRPPAGSASVLRFLLSLFSTGFVFFFSLVLTVVRQNRQEHRLFFCVPLAVRKDRRWLYHLGMLAVLLFSPAVGAIDGLAAIPPVPVPFRPEKTVGEIHSIRNGNEPFAEEGTRLPDIADYLTHRAYQEAFLFGREYRFPAMGERVGVSSYTSGDGVAIEKKFQEVFVFDEEWFDQFLDAEHPRGMLGLWLRQGVSAGSVVLKREMFSFPGPSLVRHLIICLVFGLSMVFMNNRLTPQLLYVIKSLTLRRRQEAA